MFQVIYRQAKAMTGLELGTFWGDIIESLSLSLSVSGSALADRSLAFLHFWRYVHSENLLCRPF